VLEGFATDDDDKRNRIEHIGIIPSPVGQKRSLPSKL
jgi:hypothetical protein